MGDRRGKSEMAAVTAKVFFLSGHFRLDPESGELRTAVNLDYEEVSEYVILIQANKKVFSAADFQRSGNFLL